MKKVKIGSICQRKSPRNSSILHSKDTYVRSRSIRQSFLESRHQFQQDLASLQINPSRAWDARFLSRVALNIRHLEHIVKVVKKQPDLREQAEQIEHFLSLPRKNRCRLIDAAGFYGEKEPVHSELAESLLECCSTSQTVHE